MTDPHSETITIAVLEALEGIDPADGYYMDAGKVSRYDRTAGAAGPSIILRRATEQKVLRGETWDCDLTLMIDATISIEEENQEPTDRLVAFRLDDIERALAGIDWEALRAYLVRIEATNLLEIDPNDPDDGIIVRVGINYAHDHGSTRAPLAL